MRKFRVDCAGTVEDCVVAPQVFVIDSLGIMWGTVDKRVATLAKAHNVKIMPLFTNEGFQQPGLHPLLGDPPTASSDFSKLAVD